MFGGIRKKFLYDLLFLLLCRLGCAGTSMAVTDAQNPLLGEDTCGSLLNKLQVTSLSSSFVSLQMCMVYWTLKLSIFALGNMGRGRWEWWGPWQDASSDRAGVLGCLQEKCWAGC